MRRVNAENQVEEVDRSDELLETLRRRTSTRDLHCRRQGLGHSLQSGPQGPQARRRAEIRRERRGGTMLSFGFNSALSFATETLDRARQAAQVRPEDRRCGSPGEHADGWRYNLQWQSAPMRIDSGDPLRTWQSGGRLRGKMNAGRHYGWSGVVAEGALPAAAPQTQSNATAQFPSGPPSLPGSTGDEGPRVIHRSGRRRGRGPGASTTDQSGDLSAGPRSVSQGRRPTAVDRQLGLGYGAGRYARLPRARAG